MLAPKYLFLSTKLDMFKPCTVQKGTDLWDYIGMIPIRLHWLNVYRIRINLYEAQCWKTLCVNSCEIYDWIMSLVLFKKCCVGLCENKRYTTQAAERSLRQLSAIHHYFAFGKGAVEPGRKRTTQAVKRTWTIVYGLTGYAPHGLCIVHVVRDNKLARQILGRHWVWGCMIQASPIPLPCFVY